MSMRTRLKIVALSAAVVAAPCTQAAFLSILETPTGVVFDGDANFSTNDWIGGTASQTRDGLEKGRLTAQIYNPNGAAGSQTFYVFDLDNTLSDVLTVTFTSTQSASIFDFEALFCSEGANGGLTSCALNTSYTSIYEDAFGNTGTFTSRYDPNLAMAVSSPEEVPEPLSLALVGAGLVGVRLRRHA